MARYHVGGGPSSCLDRHGWRAHAEAFSIGCRRAYRSARQAMITEIIETYLGDPKLQVRVRS